MQVRFLDCWRIRFQCRQKPLCQDKRLPAARSCGQGDRRPASKNRCRLLIGELRPRIHCPRTSSSKTTSQETGNKLSPDISVFTSFSADHQNYYKNDIDAYFSDKANIFLNQKAGDTLIIGRELWETRKQDIEGRNSRTHSRGRCRSSISHQLAFKDSWKNITERFIPRAIEAVRALGIDDYTIRHAVENFTGVEGRLELVKETNGVKIYNDTTSTMPDAALAGLEALAKNKNIILIMGGADKELKYGKSLVENLRFLLQRNNSFTGGTGTVLVRIWYRFDYYADKQELTVLKKH